jgi:hypothetical protein
MRVARMCAYGCGLLVLVLSASVEIFAAVAPAPEIDGGSLATGLGVLAASVLIIRARMRSK